MSAVHQTGLLINLYLRDNTGLWELQCLHSEVQHTLGEKKRKRKINNPTMKYLHILKISEQLNKTSFSGLASFRKVSFLIYIHFASPVFRSNSEVSCDSRSSKNIYITIPFRKEVTCAFYQPYCSTFAKQNMHWVPRKRPPTWRGSKLCTVRGLIIPLWCIR